MGTDKHNCSSSTSAGASMEESNHLPPLPSPRVHRFDSINSCGTPPASLDEQPFFLSGMRSGYRKPSLERKKTIYDDSDFGVDVKPSIKTAVMRHKNEILMQQPSQRLSEFLKHVCCSETDYQNLMRARHIEKADDYTSDAIYDIPSVKPVQQVVHTAESVVPMSVERTLYELIERYHQTHNFICTSCPLGLTQEERRKFCLRLEYLEQDKDVDWKVFAEEVMSVSPDDLTLMDEFGARHAIPPVEIVLTHWYNLSSNTTTKDRCKLANKQTIIEVLRAFKRYQLLHEMQW